MELDGWGDEGGAGGRGSRDKNVLHEKIIFNKKFKLKNPGMTACSCKPSTAEARTGRFPQGLAIRPKRDE